MDDIEFLKDQEKTKEQPSSSHSGHHWPGDDKTAAWPLVLITLGLIFLLQNLGFWTIDNWWAVFFLWPAFNSLEKGRRRWQADGQFSRRARRHFIIAAAFTALTAIFLFNLSINWHIIWPVLLIGWGVLTLLKGLDRV